MKLSTVLAEQRIRQAFEEGVFDDLPGAGEPLPPEDIDPLVPAEVRMSYKILKNAGCLPPEVEARKEIAGMATLMRAATTDEERSRASRRLQYLMLQLQCREGGIPAVEAAYYDRVMNRLNR